MNALLVATSRARPRGPAERDGAVGGRLRSGAPIGAALQYRKRFRSLRNRNLSHWTSIVRAYLCGSGLVLESCGAAGCAIVPVIEMSIDGVSLLEVAIFIMPYTLCASFGVT